MAEQCWFLRGVKIGPIYIGYLRFHSAGEESSVKFDWEKAYQDKYLLGWYHSHPIDSFVYPSNRDHKTARSWAVSLDRDILCGITCKFMDVTMDACYRFYRRDSYIVYSRLNSFLFGGLFIGVQTSQDLISV